MIVRRKKRIRRNTYKSRPGPKGAGTWSRALKSARITMVAVGFGLFNLMLIFGHDWITQTERLAIRSITVSGCERLTPEMVKAQADLAGARNILAVNLTSTRKRLMAHPWIADAQVSRDIPDHLHIRIREHQSLAVLDLGRRFLLNVEGRVFKELAPGATPDIPVISGLTYTDLGREAETPTPVMRAVMKILKPRRRSGRIDLVDRIQEIHADPALGLTLFVADDRRPEGYRTVTLGFDAFDEKYATLQRIETYLKKSHRYAGFRSINLTDPDRIVVNPEPADAAADVRKEV
mgnify:CR=1 FL=1